MKNKIHTILLFVFTYSFSQFAFASGETPVSDSLMWIIDAMTGATGIAIATVAVIMVGILCMFHFFKWTIFGAVIIGISMIFGAETLVKSIISYLHH